MDSSCTDCATDQIENTGGSPVKVTPESMETPYNPLDASTFIPPTSLPPPSVTIEFCNRVSSYCISYLKTEIFNTFSVAGKNFVRSYVYFARPRSSNLHA